MASKVPPVIDKKGRIRHIRPARSIQPDLYGDLDDLMFAAAHGRVDTVKLLLDANADVNARSRMYNSTVFGIAVTNGQADVVKVLVERGVDMNAQCIGGQTALVYAAANGELEMVKTLLDADADVNATDNMGGTPLMWAVGGGHIDTVKALLDAGADVNTKNSNGYTALSLVPTKRLFRVPLFGEFYSNKRNKELTQLLKEAGAVF